MGLWGQAGAVGVWLLACWLVGAVLLAGRVPGPRVGQAIVGGAALGLQLWLYGALGLPWWGSAVAAPWLLLAVLRWRALRDELRALPPPRGSTLLAILLLLAAGAVFLAALLQRPLTGYDAMAFWCFKAKVAWHAQAFDLARMLDGPPELRLMRQMDYPPLWPLLMDTAAVAAGRFEEGLARAAHLLFFLGGGFGLFRTARELLPAAHALALLVAWIAAPPHLSFLLQAEHMGYADHAFSVVMLLTLCNRTLSSRTLAAARGGSSTMTWVLAAIAALLKQEGLPLLLLLAALDLGRAPRLPTLRAAALALLPFLLWRLDLWRHGIHSDLLTRTAAPAPLSSRLAVVGDYVGGFLATRSDYQLVVACVLVALVALLLAPTGPLRRAGLLVLAVLAVHALLTVLVWLLSPYGTEAHVLTSLVRVASQFVPSVWLLLAVAAAAQRPAVTTSAC